MVLMTSMQAVAEPERLLATAASEWDYSRQPLVNLRCHNRERRWRAGPKHTKKGAPHHHNTLVFGPFRRGACVFRRLVKGRHSAFRERALRGIRLAHIWHMIDDDDGSPSRVRIATDPALLPHLQRMQQEEEGEPGTTTAMLQLAHTARGMLHSSAVV